MTGPKIRADKRTGELTPRETQILELIFEGKTTKQIARHLDLSYHTIKTHVANIHAKWETHSPIQMFKEALRRGLVKVD